MSTSACCWVSALAICALSLAGCEGLKGNTTNTPVTYQLTVKASGNGAITSNPSGINCPTTCSASFPQNTSVTLNETPAANSFFSGWSGACTGTSACTVTVNAPASVNANFSPGYGLTVAVSGSGSVASSPAGINCPATCSSAFPQNTTVTLNETPGGTNVFSDWSGACTGTGACSVTMNASASVTATFIAGGSLQSVNHIIFFLQENRSLDHYLGALREYWKENGIPDQSFDGLPQFNPTSGAPPLEGPPPSVPGCDPAKPYPQYTYCSPDSNNPIASFHLTSACTENQLPSWNANRLDWDLNDYVGTSPAKLNGFVKEAADHARYLSPPLMDTNGLRSMGYFDGSDLNFYYFMASNFATSDRWFSPAMDQTQINRMYLFAATSAGHAHPLAPPYGALTNTTIFQELQNAGISWKIYVNPTGTKCASTDSACLVGYSYISMFTYAQTILDTPSLLQNIVPISQYLADAQSGNLPQVALIEPASAASLDEHPNDVDTSTPGDIQAGAQYAESLITALMASPNWKDSAMILTYDEAGGLYDHVSPQPMPSPDGILPIDLKPGDTCTGTGQLGTGTCDFTWSGYRIPMIVISPFSKKNFISHTVRDYTAILSLIEKRFNLSPLTQRDAAQADMSEFFDFVNAPWSTPPSPPAQSMADACSLSAPTP